MLRRLVGLVRLLDLVHRRLGLLLLGLIDRLLRLQLLGVLGQSLRDGVRHHDREVAGQVHRSAQRSGGLVLTDDLDQQVAHLGQPTSGIGVGAGKHLEPALDDVVHRGGARLGRAEHLLRALLRAEQGALRLLARALQQRVGLAADALRVLLGLLPRGLDDGVGLLAGDVADPLRLLQRGAADLGDVLLGPGAGLVGLFLRQLEDLRHPLADHLVRRS